MPTSTDDDTVNRDALIRAHTVAILTRTVDCTQQLYWPVRAAAFTALTRYGITTREDMRNVLRGGDPYPESTVAQEIGSEVADAIRGWLAAAQTTAVRPGLITLLSDLLNLSDRQLQQLIGEHYLPQPEDLPDGEQP